MEFANILLLFGGAALSVPLVIHLLNRSKFEVVPWAAMHLLKSAELQNQRRMKWRSWLLLLLRCLIPLLLAVCMARPLLTAWRTSTGDGQTSLTVVLDNSYSLQADSINAKDQSNKQDGQLWARTQIQNILQNLGNTTQYSMILAGESAEDITNGRTFDHRSVYRDLQKWDASSNTLSTSEALAAARKSALASPMSNHQVLVISDFQSFDWTQLLEKSTQKDKDALQWSLLPVIPAEQENLQVRLEHRYSESLGVNETLAVRATIRNLGKQERENVTVDFLVDQKAIASRKISVAAGTQSQVVFGCQFEEAGIHQLSLKIDDPSGWSADNTDTLTVTVLDKLQVLLIDSDIDSNSASTNFFWNLALQASVNSAEGTAPWLQTRRTTASQLRETWIQTADVIVMADVPRLADEMREIIAEQVNQGAGLLIIPGPNLEPEWYADWNAIASSNTSPESNVKTEPQPFIPARIGMWQVADATEQSANEQSANNPSVSNNFSDSGTGSGKRLSIAQGPYPNSALAYFDSESAGGLSEVRLFAWSQLEAQQDAEIDAQLTNDAPFLVTRTHGKGQVAIIATGCDEQSSNFALRPAFVPFVQRVTMALSGKSNETVRTSFGSQESNPAYLSDEQLTELAESLNAVIVHDADEYLTHLETQQNGQEIWRWILMALLVFLFAELFVQRPFSEGV